MLLTGTPVQNNMEEYYAMIQFVNPFSLNMDVKAFKKIFQTPIEAGSERGASSDAKRIGQARLTELQTLTKEFVLR